MSEKIKVVIDKVGGTKIEAMGFTGEGCTLATKALENALGGGDRKLKPEFYETEKTEEHVHLKTGETW